MILFVADLFMAQILQWAQLRVGLVLKLELSQVQVFFVIASPQSDKTLLANPLNLALTSES